MKYRDKHLTKFPSSLFTSIEWTTQTEAQKFLESHDLFLEDLKPNNKWKIRYSDKKKGVFILQCCCGSYNLENKVRKSRQMYKFVGCLAWARIKKYNNEYSNILGYLSHLEACSNLIPINPPPLNLNNTVKLMAQNMLRLNIDPIKIIEDNIMFIVKNLNGKVINNHNNERYLLSNQDIINIRNSVTKDMWNIDIRRPVEINIHQFFGKDAVDNEIKTSTIFYKPC